ncbi:hypothetical protein [Frigidibacter sp. SD6-1]|uniref:hypothetical protein n=1 Tax=Frigidibacter sp. SD6-1 TaxID=3032581 RepID=UPI0024DFF4A8|nr:hypothetical protein [Frigidibacter sp. SD6-1]
MTDSHRSQPSRTDVRIARMCLLLLLAGGAPTCTVQPDTPEPERLSLRIVSVQPATREDDSFTRYRLNISLDNLTDRDFCLLYRFDAGDGEEARALALGRQGLAALEIKLPSGEFVAPLTGFPDTAFEDQQKIARYGLKRVKANSAAEGTVLISDEERNLDGRSARYRVVTEGFWCDAAEQAGLKAPFTFDEVNRHLVEDHPREDSRPALLALRPSDEVFLESRPTRKLYVEPADL